MIDLPLSDSQLPNATSQQTSSLSEDTISITQVDNGEANDHYLIGLYYKYIHPAHPFLLPQRLYQENPNVFPSHLKRAICFIASHHSSSDTEQLRDASNTVFNPGVVNDGFKVQSLILVTLASYARFERDRGNQALRTAIDIAHQIDLNSDAFSRDQEPLFRESWRRTWWELYTISGLISLISGTNIRLSQPVSMTLPCDSEAYDICQVPRTGDVKEMQQRFRLEAPPQWSSFAYKVESMRILSMVLDANSRGCSSTKQSAEAAVSSWLLSLPEEKQDSLQSDGEVDEVMSCALMIIHLAGICLHLPQSPLAHVGDFRTICGNHLGQAISENPRVHKVAALKSAKALARLLTLHSSVKTLSPCFSCAIAFSSAVLLAEYSTQVSPRPQYLSENLQLELSALQSVGQTWPIARVVRSQIAGFARDVMDKAPNSNCTDAVTELAPMILDDQWFQDLLNENVILPEDMQDGQG
ncbi:hypothetical protein ACHAPJ_006577 [Fusarium lateritium]